MSSSMQQLIEQISGLSVMEVVDLVKALEEKWGVSAAAPVSAQVASAGAAVAAVEEKSAFDVVMTSVGDKKINVIKAVKEITGLGLAEAKAIVDSALPKTIKEGVKKDEAQQMKTKLEAEGAKIELK